VHELLAPAHVSLNVDDRLIKLDASQGEFLLFHIFFALLHNRLNNRYADLVPMKAAEIPEMVEALPESVVPAYRKKRAYISSLLSKNEVSGSNPYGKQLFKRQRQGWYVLNPKLALRYKEEWVDIYRLAGIDLIAAVGLDERFGRMVQSLISPVEKA